MKFNFNDTNQKRHFYRRFAQISKRLNSFVSHNYNIIKKLGNGSCGTVYKISTNINGEPMNIVQKKFTNDDDYNEIYANWQIRKTIERDASKFSSDNFLYECIEKVPFLYLTKEQYEILSKSKTIEEEFTNSQKASELRNGIFFEIKGNQNLDDLINSNDYKDLTFDDKQKILLDILMGATLLDKSRIIQRDLNCENIQIDLTDKKNPKAYLIDFGKAIHIDLIHLFDDDERTKNDYCAPFYYSAPPEAYENGDAAFSDKYNSFNIGLIILALFFGKSGYDLMYDFKWSDNDDIVKNRKNLFYNLDKVINDLCKKENYYTNEQITFIKYLMFNLINPDVKKRWNSETLARVLYNHRFGISNECIAFCQFLVYTYCLLLLFIAGKDETKKLNRLMDESNIDDESFDEIID